MAALLFLDDSSQKNCSRKGVGSLVAVGGIAIEDASAAALDRELDDLCRSTGFPPGEIFKWSPAKDHWMRENLVEEARLGFFRTVLEAVARHNGVAQVVVSDRSRGTVKHEDHEQDVILLTLERFNLSLKRDQVGIVIVARPSGGRGDEDAFLSDCADIVAAGSQYMQFKLAMNVVTMPMQNSRVLQAADLIVSCTTALVAGHTRFAEPLFPSVKALLRSAGGRCGGVGLKVHPDFIYLNLYHWLLGDDYYRRGNAGYPLPRVGFPYSSSPDDF